MLYNYCNEYFTGDLMKRLIGAALVLALLFCGCGNAEPEQTASFPIDESLYAMSEDLYSFTAALNGKVMQFPLKYEEFIKSGWELKPNHKQVTLKSGQYSIYGITKGELSTEAYFANLGEADAKLSDCLVCGVSVAATDGVQLDLSGGIRLGKALKSDVKTSYGEPSSIEGDTLIYEQSREVGAKLIFKENLLYEVYLYNITNPFKVEFSDKVPKAVKQYRDPEGLSADLEDFAFYLYGTTYTMPLPLSRMIEGGWMLAGKSTEQIPPGETYSDAVKVTHSNRTLTLTLKNVADYPTTPENCFVTAIESTSDVKLDMTLANGCRVGATKYNFESTFGRENFTSVEEKGKESIYIYTHPDRGTLTVITNDETGYITSIKVEMN